jgi:hypothetical protein
MHRVADLEARHHVWQRGARRGRTSNYPPASVAGAAFPRPLQRWLPCYW